ncbi:MAG: exonuclease domain-containing protein [Clostridia bacterium]|nr:exonuclease domain-containing protein [Clostridia bacterium]
MNYIIFDLELNSKPFKNRHPNEVIEIGAVKLDENLNFAGEFQSFAKPKIYKKIFKVVKNKTHILQQDIDEAEEFKVVIDRFKQWIGTNGLLCSWGHDDIHHLKTNCKFNKVGSRWLKESIDIQKQFSRIYDLPKGQVFSLKNALAMLEIPVEEELHRADIDARYTAEIFKKIFDQLDFGHLKK